MNKDNFKTIIQIKRMLSPNSTAYDITEHDYTVLNNPTKKIFNYISYSERIICINKKEALTQITSDKYIYNKKDKLFFGAGCTIPRHKVREWGKQHDISITIKPEKANVNVISNNWVNNLFGYWSSYYNVLVDKNNFIEFLELNYTDTVDTLIQLIKDSEYDKLIINKHDHKDIMGHKQSYYNHSNKVLTPTEIKEKKEKIGVISQYCEMFGHKEWKTEDKDYEWDLIDDSKQKCKDLNKLFDLDASVTTILDTTLVDMVNKNAITIDDEMANQLFDMLNSADKKNHILAMEIIANSNYRTSLHKILLIFRRIGWRVYDRPEKNHVNFKSLIKFIDLHEWSNPSYDDIIKSLIAKKYLTKEILEEIMPLVKTEIKADISNYHPVFKVNTITVSNEVKRYFGIDIPLSKEELEELEENN